MQPAQHNGSFGNIDMAKLHVEWQAGFKTQNQSNELTLSNGRGKTRSRKSKYNLRETRAEMDRNPAETFGTAHGLKCTRRMEIIGHIRLGQKMTHR